MDLPPQAATASGAAHPDLEADIRTLDCPSAALREIRLHHVLEHFERAEALALLVRWHEWLAPGGVLVVETPDFERCVAGFAERTFAEQTLILRHLFGSQEAPWAQHRDGWSAGRFVEILTRLGFDRIESELGFSDEPGLLHNVCVTARKAAAPPAWDERRRAGLELLELSMNGATGTELRLLESWHEAFSRTLGHRSV